MARGLHSGRAVQLQLFDTLPPRRPPIRLGRLLSELGRLLRRRRTALAPPGRSAVDAVSLVAIRRIGLSVGRRRRRAPRSWLWRTLSGR